MKQYLSIKDVCGRLRCSPAMIYRLVYDKKIPFIQLGTNSRIFFDPDDIEDFLQSKKTQPVLSK